MMFKYNNKLSKYSIAFCLLVVVVIIFSSKDWRKDNKIIAADVVSYYAYLPATFIFHDLKLEKRETFDKGIFWPEDLPDGNKVIKTTMGMSFLYAPFFFLSHGTAKLLGMEAYGFSAIYKIGLLIGVLVYFFLGLFFLQKILLRYFPDKLVALTTIVIALGTNLLYYTGREGTMTHLYNFALINLFVYLSVRWYEKQKFPVLLLLGALAGLITLIRPSNIVILLFFFLYQVYSWRTFIQRIKMVFSRFHWFLAMGLAFVLIWVPQMIYWYSVTGNLFVDSYPDERFYFGNPHFIDCLFSYRKGWFVYTPVMLLSVLGMPLLFKRMKEFGFAISVFFLSATYIIVSWWCWWYGGSFGMRAFVDYYGILAIPIALLFSELIKIRKKFFAIVVLITCIGVAQNLFFMEKYKKGSLHWDSTTKASFWNSFFGVHTKPGYWELLRAPDYQKALEGIDAYADDKK